MIKADWLIIAAVVLFFSCHVITNYLIWHISGVAVQIGAAENVVIQFEANPLARYVLASEDMSLIFTMVIFPGMVGGLYYFMRRYLLSKGDELTLTSIAVMIVVVAFSNFLNDFSILLGIFL